MAVGPVVVPGVSPVVGPGVGPGVVPGVGPGVGPGSWSRKLVQCWSGELIKELVQA